MLREEDQDFGTQKTKVENVVAHCKHLDEAKRKTTIGSVVQLSEVV